MILRGGYILSFWDLYHLWQLNVFGIFDVQACLMRLGVVEAALANTGRLCLAALGWGNLGSEWYWLYHTHGLIIPLEVAQWAALLRGIRAHLLLHLIIHQFQLIMHLSNVITFPLLEEEKFPLHFYFLFELFNFSLVLFQFVLVYLGFGLDGLPCDIDLRSEPVIGILRLVARRPAVL